jgi:enterochelin esterase-like enzyme
MRCACLAVFLAAVVYGAPAFKVSLGSTAAPGPVDGRLIVAISKDTKKEPRFQVGWSLDTAQIFGIDVDQWTPGSPVMVTDAAAGHPLKKLSALPPGKYNVQGVLNVYETIRRSDGVTLKLPMDNGEGQQWNASPNNLFSKPKVVEITSDSITDIELTEVIPPIEPPKDTKYVRHFRMQSSLLTSFWGRPTFLSAIVLVPEGFDEHPESRYPVAYHQGHFPSGFPYFRDAQGPPGDKSAQFGHRFYQEWTSGRLPKMLVVLTQHATAFYDDSYGVNSANMGPYGDALTKEFYPALEQKFRAINEPWARVVYGGSTGGWMTLAQQILYPDFFGGAWGFCPDPVDFHAFQLVDVYNDKNAYYDIGPFARMPRPLGRLRNDHILATMEGFSQQEAVLGSKGRSGGQMDAFHATFGPAGKDGYPAKLWDSETGEIDREVARYWTENYDLTAILQRDWERLGPKLIGKLHVTMGTKDTFYLDAAAHRMEQFLESTKLPRKGPYYGGSFEFADNEPHCYAGKIPEGQALETYYLPIFAEHMRKMAPQGADLQTWK